MDGPRVCPQCGIVVKDKLYRHNIDVHNKRLCLFCPRLEGRKYRMKEHIQKQHLTADVSLHSMVYRHESEPIQAIPVTFPTPPGYVPYSDVDFEENWTYVPTPIRQCPKSCITVNTTHLKQPAKPATVLSESATSFSSMPLTSETDPTTTAPITSSAALPDISAQDKVNSSGILDLSSPEQDYEFVEDNSSGTTPLQHRVTETAIQKNLRHPYKQCYTSWEECRITQPFSGGNSTGTRNRSQDGYRHGFHLQSGSWGACRATAAQSRHCNGWTRSAFRPVWWWFTCDPCHNSTRRHSAGHQPRWLL